MRRRWHGSWQAVIATTLLLACAPARAQTPSYGARLEGFAYPYPVRTYRFTSQRQTLEMAYMDVQPARPNGRVVVLLHGKNFCAATWEATIAALVANGYRVVAPDQIGFCKSSKPAAYQFGFGELAANTHGLLAGLGIDRYVLVGHSTGGMLAIRYALIYPHEPQQLVLVDPVGLEDWQARGVPYRTVDQWYRRELGTTQDSIRAYERSTYYAGTWTPAYERWVRMLAGMYGGPGRDQVAWDSALLYEMIFTEPVVYEFGRLDLPVTLIIGDRDTTAIGKDAAPPALAATLGNYPALGRAAARAMPHATLVEFPDYGHAPQIEDPAAFDAVLLHALDTSRSIAPP